MPIGLERRMALLAVVWPALASQGGAGDAAVFPVRGFASAPLQSDFLLADADGDAHVDAVGCREWDQWSVYFMRGLGDGTLDAPAIVPLQAPPGRLHAADMNGDGAMEMLVAHSAYQDVPNPMPLHLVFLQPSGQPLALPIAPASSPVSSVFTGDLDGDGDRDIIERLHQGGPTRVRTNLGSFLFAPPAPLTGVAANATSAADLDGDGWTDLMGTAPFPARVLVFRNSAGQFLTEVTLATSELGYIGGIATGDLTGDGVLDVAAATPTGKVFVFRGLGGAQYAAPIVVPVPESFGNLAIADGDGDHVPDLLGAATSGAVFVRNLGAGAFAPASQSLVFPFSTARFADLTEDGRADLAFATSSFTEGSVFVAPGRPGGGFEGGEPLAEPFAATPVLLPDLDADGLADAVALGASADLKLYRGTGGTQFQLAAALSTFTEVGESGAADLNGDAAADVLLRLEPPIGMPQPGPGAALLLSPPGGGIATSLTGPDLPYASQYGFGDLDLDGDVDLAMGGLGDSLKAAIALNDGTGTFAPESIVGFAGVGVSGVLLEDVTQDGRLDLLIGLVEVVGPQSGRIRLLPGAPGATFLPPTGSADVPCDARKLVRCDVDGDGIGDALAGPGYGSEAPVDLALVRVFANGLLALQQSFDAPFYGFNSVRSGDLDGDGRGDVVAAAGIDLTVLRGQAGGAFSGPEHHGAPGGVPFDGDGDGLLDLLGSSWLTRNLSDPTFCKLGFGKPGSFGVPLLEGIGSLDPGASVTIRVSGAKPGAPMVIVLGAAQANLPAFGGTLVPSPHVVGPILPLDAAGTFSATALAPPLPPGATFWLHALIADPVATQGVAFSNALRAEH